MSSPAFARYSILRSRTHLMIIASRNLKRISILSLAAVLIFLGGCRFFSTEPAPIRYTARRDRSRCERPRRAIRDRVKDGAIYVSDGGRGTIRRIDADGMRKRSSRVSARHRGSDFFRPENSSSLTQVRIRSKQSLPKERSRFSQASTAYAG
jgi:hypothetical protein